MSNHSPRWIFTRNQFLLLRQQVRDLTAERDEARATATEALTTLGRVWTALGLQSWRGATACSSM